MLATSHVQLCVNLKKWSALKNVKSCPFIPPWGAHLIHVHKHSRLLSLSYILYTTHTYSTTEVCIDKHAIMHTGMDTHLHYTQYPWNSRRYIQYSVLACAIVKFSELLLLRNNCFSGRMVSPGHICTWAQKTSDKIIQWVHKMPWACIVFTEGRSQSIVLLATHTIWLSYNIWIVLLHQMEIENVGILLITAC